MTTKLWTVVATAALFLIGCRESTFKPPTDDIVLKKIESDTNIDTQLLFSKSVNDFTRANLNKVDGPWSPAGTALIGLVFLNAASDTTFKDVVQSLHYYEPDYSPLNQGANNWLIDNFSDENLSIKNGIFMVWPYKLDKPFLTRMAQSFNVDLIKLGSPSATSQQAVDSWAKSKGYSDKPVYDPFEKARDKMMSLGFYRFSENWPGPVKNGTFLANTSVMGHAGRFRSTLLPLGDKWEILFLDEFAVPERGVPTEAEWSNLMSPQKKADLTIQFIPKSRHRTDMSVVFPKSLQTGPLNLQYMSLSLKDDCTIVQQWAHMDLDLIPTGGSIQDRSNHFVPRWYIIRDVAKKVPIVVGQCEE